MALSSFGERQGHTKNDHLDQHQLRLAKELPKFNFADEVLGGLDRKTSRTFDLIHADRAKLNFEHLTPSRP
jgi:hypothetical protein